MPVVDCKVKLRTMPRSSSQMSLRYSKIRNSSGESSSDSDSGNRVDMPLKDVSQPRKFVSRYFPQDTPKVAYANSKNLWNSCPSNSSTMVSRRKILSRSRDGLNADYQEEEDDIWFQKDRLFKDHVQEVLNKWKQIDDEIWAKIIVMERNRRVAKAYARAPVLTINGSDDGFDGYRIGLCGFDNPMRDAKTEEIKKHIGHGVKIKMDDGGNIMVKRISKSNVYVKDVKSEENSISNDVIIAGGLLEMEKPVKAFDMKKFASNVNRELRRAYPDRRKLESQCISAISFVKDSPELLDCSCWVMIINIVALDMLRSKFPPVSKRSNVEKIDRRHLSQEENAYSVLSNFSEGAAKMNDAIRDPKPPKLPPRDVDRVPVPTPDYDDWKHEHPLHQMPQQSGYKDDPYYCGMKARVPNFVKKYAQHQIPDPIAPVRKSHSSGYLSLLRQNDKPINTRRGSDIFTDEELARNYGRMKAAPSQTHGMFVGEWE